MKRLSSIQWIVLLLLLLFSCNKNSNENDYLNCLPDSKRDLVLKANQSFERFLENNFDNSVNEFLEYLIRDKKEIDLIFDQNDRKLFFELESNLFHELAFTIEKIDLKKNKWKYPKNIQDKINNGTFTNNWSTDINYSGAFFQCLEGINDKNHLVEQYLKMVRAVGSLNTVNLALGIKKQYEKGENEFVVKQILLMEYYYFKLKSKYNK